MHRSTRYRIIEAGLILMVSICSLMLGLTWKQCALLKGRVRDHASALFRIIVLTRQWNSDYGGVFVLKTEDVVSNPYLENPDITDITGNVYTKKNPALMTREISEMATEQSGFTYHITSLKLMNPNNAPDDWERAALESFENGVQEVETIAVMNDRHTYRLIRPLYIEASCLGCHYDQEYSLGDVRGGISVNLPYQETMLAIRHNNAAMITLLVAFIGIFGLTLYVFVWKVMSTLEKQKNELETLNYTKNKFLGMCAHDLRNPMTVINSYAELMLMDAEDGSVSADHVSFLENIKMSVNRMLDMVNTLLDVSAIEAGQLELCLARDSLKPLVEKQIENGRVFADKKHITIRADLQDVPESLFDRNRVSQMLDNIISNAIKYSPPGSTVYVGLDFGGGYARISVRDEGPGIPEDEQAMLFQDFKRLSTRPTGGESSTGLGLAIVKKIVEHHHGIIEVVSHPGEGSEFVVKLPVNGSM